MPILRRDWDWHDRQHVAQGLEQHHVGDLVGAVFRADQATSHTREKLGRTGRLDRLGTRKGNVEVATIEGEWLA